MAQSRSSRIHLIRYCTSVSSRQDLSHVVGVANESLVRTLSDFKAEKLIELKEGKVVILEEEKLRNFLY